MFLTPLCCHATRDLLSFILPSMFCLTVYVPVLVCGVCIVRNYWIALCVFWIYHTCLFLLFLLFFKHISFFWLFSLMRRA